MTIYVDQLFVWPISKYESEQALRIGEQNKHQWCHMFTDEKESAELHAMARVIGLRPEWFQDNHYNLTPGKRCYAISLGAKAVDKKEAVEIWQRQKRGQVKTCEHIQTECIMPGWICCQCRTYNGYQRESCKTCKHIRCSNTGGSTQKKP